MAVTKERIIALAREAVDAQEACKKMQGIAYGYSYRGDPQKALEGMAIICGMQLPLVNAAVAELAVMQANFKVLERKKHQQSSKRKGQNPVDQRLSARNQEWTGGTIKPGQAPTAPKPAPPAAAASAASEAWKQAMLHPTMPSKPEPEASAASGDRVIISKEGKDVIERHLDYDPQVLDPAQLAPGKPLF